MQQHPKVLFSSVFKPFAEADTLYSRVDSKIELFHNQLTKYQGIFSPRVHYSTFGLHAIANNLGMPSVVLDFPTLPRFIEELKKGYDYVGIGSIVPNFQKVKRMTEEIRRLSPQTKIVLGGFCAMIDNLDKLLEVDYICQGEGISFMRELLGRPPEFEFKTPVVSAQTREILGVPFFWGEHRPVVIVGLGCPYGCDFCSPSHFFGKKHIKFLNTGRQIFDQMVRLSEKFRSKGLGLVGDDNFLADENRAKELHQIVKKSGKQFNLYIFASANLVSKWDPAELAEMGIYNIWIGRESKFAPYPKNREINMKELIASLHKAGINATLSSILLFDFHTRENIWQDIEDHLACNPDFSQFSFYAPAPGTPLYQRLKAEARLMMNIPFEEWHAFKQPWFIHPEFSLLQAEKIQEKAYLEDFYRLGPGLTRLIQTDLEGYLNMKDSRNPLLRDRAQFIARNFSAYRAVLKAVERLVPKPNMAEQAREIRKKLEKISRQTSAFESLEALGLVGFGKLREWRTRHFGDAIQPKTRLTYYTGAD